jgi:hypothetical protein
MALKLVRLNLDKATQYSRSTEKHQAPYRPLKLDEIADADLDSDVRDLIRELFQMNDGVEYVDEDDIRLECVHLEKHGLVILQDAALGQNARVASTPQLLEAMEKLRLQFSKS